MYQARSREIFVHFSCYYFITLHIEIYRDKRLKERTGLKSHPRFTHLTVHKTIAQIETANIPRCVI
jgi:hypothetical protein